MNFNIIYTDRFDRQITLKNFKTMKILLLFTILACFLPKNIYSQPETMWQLLMDGSIIKWAYAGGDEFNGNELDYTKWLDSYPWGRNLYCNQELQYYTDGDNIELGFNSVINSGTLRLIAKEETVYERVVPYLPDNEILYCDGNSMGQNKRYFDYTSGMVFYKQKFKYGLFEIRFKTPYGQGFWPAFWLYAGHENEEIDIFEMKGERPNEFHWDIHYPDAPSWWGDWVPCTGNFPDGFNIIRGEWGPNTIFWSLNYDEFGFFIPYDYNYPMMLIANLAIAGSCDNDAAFCPGPDDTTPFPGIFEIDFIRIWKRLDCDEIVNINNYSQTATDPTVITGKNINVTNLTLNQGQNLTLIATEEIVIGPETTIEGEFSASIVECPGPNKTGYGQWGNLKILKDSLDKNLINIDTINTYNKKIIPVSMSVYPNPTKGIITIEIPDNIEESISIQIINSLGNIIYRKDNVKEKYFNIDIFNKPKGTYLFKAVIGKKVFLEKFIYQ